MVVAIVSLESALYAQGVVTYQGLRLTSSDSTANAISLLPPSGITPYTLTLPPTQGASGQPLVNDGNGLLSWGSISTPLSSIAGAAQSRTLANTAAQSWTWSTLDTATTAFTLSSNSTAAASNLQTLLSVNSSGTWTAADVESSALHMGGSTRPTGRNVALEIDVRSGTNNYALIASSGVSALGWGYSYVQPKTQYPTAGLHIGDGKIRFTSGTNLTTPQAGAWEYNGTVFYSTVANDNRGVIPSESAIVLTADNTLTSQTAVQPIFDGTGTGGSANGRVYLAAGTYEFECMLHLTGLSTTSSSFGFALTAGTATIASQRWFTMGRKNTGTETLATDATVTGVMATAANTAIVSAGTVSTGYVFISGIVRISAAGTITPQISLGTAAAAVVKKNSYFVISPLGSSTVTTQGNWK